MKLDTEPVPVAKKQIQAASVRGGKDFGDHPGDSGQSRDLHSPSKALHLPVPSQTLPPVPGLALPGSYASRG